MDIWFSAVLERVEAYSNHLRILYFKSLEKKPLPFVPGQFIKLEMQDPEPFQRSYSIATLSESRDLNDGLEIALSYVEQGRATAFAFNAKTGVKVNVYGPYGQFVLPEEKPKRLWLIATSTGVVPYKSMLLQLKAWLKSGVEVHVLLGAKNDEGMLYKSLLLTWQKTEPNFHCYFCYSQHLPDNSGSYDYLGRVQAVLKQQTLQPGEDLFYLCGNPLMIDETWQWLKEKGFSVKQVKREKYVFAVKR